MSERQLTILEELEVLVTSAASLELAVFDLRRGGEAATVRYLYTSLTPYYRPGQPILASPGR